MMKVHVFAAALHLGVQGTYMEQVQPGMFHFSSGLSSLSVDVDGQQPTAAALGQKGNCRRALTLTAFTYHTLHSPNSGPHRRQLARQANLSGCSNLASSTIQQPAEAYTEVLLFSVHQNQSWKLSIA
ncbi:hypothetical protein EDD37DRAFT_457331 [Exophiala viscosa]|uniref:uncharacterized protein n=1 Tax=Exophiala viscosa TaxID=2486360 RepID=UPI00219ACFF2|nr:hypothetical protein EDD37DRAFT_457331 [Exophiala viscosa]